MIRVVIEMPSWAPESWKDSVRCARLDELVAASAGAGVGVDGAALQRGQRELGGDEERRACGEHDETEKGKQGPGEAHRSLAGFSPGPVPG